MTVSYDAVDAAPPASRDPERQYGFSVLATGFTRLFRQPVAFGMVILGNAIVQMLLTLWTPIIDSSWQSVVSVLLSLVSLLLSFAWVCRLALATIDGKLRLGELCRQTPVNLVRFVGWVVAELVVIFVLTALGFWPGLVVMLVIPFVALAAIDGKPALSANFRAIRERFGRYLTVMLWWIIIMLVSDVLLGLGAITLPPWALALFGWIYKGLIGAWLAAAFAALFRSTRAGAANVDVQP